MVAKIDDFRNHCRQVFGAIGLININQNALWPDRQRGPVSYRHRIGGGCRGDHAVSQQYAAARAVGGLDDAVQGVVLTDEVGDELISRALID